MRIVGLAVDARVDARSRVQPLQRHRLGPDQRKPEVLTEGLLPETREFLKNRGGTYLNGDLTIRISPSPTAPMMAAMPS
jgi:hypothetical protein